MLKSMILRLINGLRNCLPQVSESWSCDYHKWKNSLGWGKSSGQFIDKVFEYDPIADLWSEKSSMSIPRSGVENLFRMENRFGQLAVKSLERPQTWWKFMIPWRINGLLTQSVDQEGHACSLGCKWSSTRWRWT